jgi:hypothetical protein
MWVIDYLIGKMLDNFLETLGGKERPISETDLNNALGGTLAKTAKKIYRTIPHLRGSARVSALNDVASNLIGASQAEHRQRFPDEKLLAEYALLIAAAYIAMMECAPREVDPDVPIDWLGEARGYFNSWSADYEYRYIDQGPVQSAGGMGYASARNLDNKGDIKYFNKYRREFGNTYAGLESRL